jgi:membrane fusion protein, adhesin transport system
MAGPKTDFDMLREQRKRTLPAMELARTPRSATRLAVVLGIILLAALPALLLAPWTQTVFGNGQVIAWNPTLRPQFLTANIEGRVKKWHVYENQKITRGQLLVTMEDNDPMILKRLQGALEDTLSQIRQAKSRETINMSRVNEQKNAKLNALLALDAGIRSARENVAAADQRVSMTIADRIAAKSIYDRAVVLMQDKNRPLAFGNDFDLAKGRKEATENNVIMNEKLLLAAKESLTSLEKTRDSQESNLEALVNLAEESLTMARGEINRLERELASQRIQIARQENLEIFAPVDGTIFRLLANGEAGGQLVRPTDRLARIVPVATKRYDITPEIMPLHGCIAGVGAEAYKLLTDQDHPDMVAELAIDGNDLPIIKQGDRVILQFEGWAAVQFAAYPEAATGTFEGIVYVIDPTADDKGQFRILVRPVVLRADGTKVDPWPDETVLRQGVRAQGWVLVNQVSVGYELWRLLNGFPVAREQKTKQGGSILGPVGK